MFYFGMKSLTFFFFLVYTEAVVLLHKGTEEIKLI